MIYFQLAALCFLIAILQYVKKDAKEKKEDGVSKTVEAYQRGYDEGYKAGYSAGLAERGVKDE